MFFSHFFLRPEHVLVPAVRPTETPETPPEATAEDAFLEDVVPAYPENSMWVI